MVDLPPVSGQQADSPPDWLELVGKEVHPKVQGATPGSISQEDEPPKGHEVDTIRKEKAADMRANRSLRETYSEKAYKLASGCICAWFVLLGAQGVVHAATGVEMWSDKVIIAVTTGVTVSVLAAFLGVIRGLFGNGNGNGNGNK